jgi:hypothetical protein
MSDSIQKINFCGRILVLTLLLPMTGEAVAAQTMGFAGPRVIAKGDMDSKETAPQLFSDGNSILVMFPDEEKIIEFDREGKKRREFNWDRPKAAVGWDSMFVSHDSVYIVNRAQDAKKIFRIDRTSGSQELLPGDVQSPDSLSVSDSGLFETQHISAASAGGSKARLKKILGPKQEKQKAITEEGSTYMDYSDDRKKIFLSKKNPDKPLWEIDTPKEWADFLTLELLGQDSSGKLIVEVGWCSPAGTMTCGPAAQKEWKVFIMSGRGGKILAQTEISVADKLPKMVLAKDGVIDRISEEGGIWKVLSWNYDIK